MKTLNTVRIWATFICLLPVAGFAVSKSLPYPTEDKGLSAEQIIEQVYFVNHFYAFKNYGIGVQGDLITVVINRAASGSISTNTVERYINNDYNDGTTNMKDLVIFRSGKLRGTGMLITDYLDDAQSPSYIIWLPTLRRIRRFVEPAHEDAWSGSDFTFGDVYLRKPRDETHELLDKEIFADCLRVLEIPQADRNRYMQDLPSQSCVSQGREVYKIKSTTRFNNWWYDYRVSYVDTETFADYRTDYFKNAQYIKVVERDWRAMPGYSGNDPRALSWGYWYGKNLQSGHESWAVIPLAVVTFNDDQLKSSLWTESTLTKIRR